MTARCRPGLACILTPPVPITKAMPITHKNLLCHTGTFTLIVCAFALTITGCGATPQPASFGNTADILFVEDADPAVKALPYTETELLIQPYPGADPAALAALYEEQGASVVAMLGEIEASALEVSFGQLEPVAQALAESGLIETVQKDYIYQASATPNDPDLGFQLHLPQIGAQQAWDETVGSAAIVVAIVDTGVEPDHPDLRDKIIEGWNAITGDTDYADGVGHGTLVAGTAAAASDNGVGVAGVAWNSPLLVVRVADNLGRSSARHIATGILWAVAHGARVINVSFAPLWSNRIVQAAAQHAFHRGCLVVISAGNSGTATRSRGFSAALFVGAVDGNNLIADFSDTGPFVDLVAPGVDIYATARGGWYHRGTGTSFAAPIVSGVAALVWSVNPQLRPATVESVILSSAVDVGAQGRDWTYGYGVVNAAAAVNEALRRTFTPDDDPPQVRIVRPIDGTTISGRYVVGVEATDTWGVGDVVLWVDGVPHATDTRSPYHLVIDTNNFEAGAHVLSVVATDSAGNASQPQTVTVTFKRWSRRLSTSLTDIAFTSPDEGATVSGDVLIRASLADSDGLATIEWLIDGESVFVTPVSGDSAGASYLLRTGQLAAGSHTITLVVVDARGDSSRARLTLFVR